MVSFVAFFSISNEFNKSRQKCNNVKEIVIGGARDFECIREENLFLVLVQGHTK